MLAQEAISESQRMLTAIGAFHQALGKLIVDAYRRNTAILKVALGQLLCFGRLSGHGRLRFEKRIESSIGHAPRFKK